MATQALPEPLRQGVAGLVKGAQDAFADDLQAIVMFGSAAEERLRATSDVNVVIVLRRVEGARIDAFRDHYRFAHGAARVRAMFLRADELALAAQAFPVKVTDIVLRHHVLYGADPFAALQVPREPLRRQAIKIAFNLTLQLRERYTLLSLREEQLAPVLAEVAPPLRACAAALLCLEGRPAGSPREALETVIAEAADPRWSDALALFPKARQGQPLAPGQARSAVLALGDLAVHLRMLLQAGGGDGS